MDSVGQSTDFARDNTGGLVPDGLDSEQVRRTLITPPRSEVSRPPRDGVRRGGRVASGDLAEGPPRYNANNVSRIQEKTSSEADFVRQERRSRRFALRQILWGISSLDRVKKCGRTTNGSEDGGAAIKWHPTAGAYWSGFCSCGSIWACPVCQAKIRNSRADEIARAVAKHMIDNGGTAWMVTLTARHKKHHDLVPVLDSVANGWRKLMSGAAWVGDERRGTVGEKQKLGVLGNIRSMEVTYGTANGWHPHLHVILLLTKESGPELAFAMHRWDKVWRGFLKTKGFEPSQKHGITWSKVTTPQEAGEYIAKVQDGKGVGNVGNELARGDMKGGRLGTVTPFELLEYFRQTGDTAVIRVWQEYEKGTFRRRAITWSRGLRAELLGDEPELTDEELAAQEVDGDTWALLPAESLTAMRRVPGLQSRLLDAAENGGFAELVNLLTAYHLTYSTPARPALPVAGAVGSPSVSAGEA